MALHEIDNLIFSSSLPLEKLMLQKHENGNILTASSGTELFVYFIQNLDPSKTQEVKLCCSKTVESAIVELIIHNNKVYVVTKTGVVSSLDRQKWNDEDDGDIFDCDESGENWKIEEVWRVPQTSSILAATSTKLGICLLAQISGYPSVEMYLIAFQDKTDRLVISEGIPSAGSLCLVNISHLSYDFINYWLHHIKRSEEMLFIGLNDGHLYCVPLVFPLIAYSVYTSVHSVIALGWFQDRCSERFDALIMVLESGAVIRLTPIGQDVSYPFLPLLSSATVTNSSVLSLGEFQLRILDLADTSDECNTLPFSEVISACPMDKSRTFLLSDKHNRIFMMNLDNLRKGGNEPKKIVPTGLLHSSNLQLLISSSLQISTMNRALGSLDEYLRALSLISRKEILKEHFQVSVRTVQIMQEMHTMRVRISFNLPGVVLNKDFWKLDIIICTSGGGRLSYRYNISTNMTCESKLIQLVTLSIPFHLIYNFECQFTCCIEGKAMELCLSAGKIELDASYFFLPPSLIELSKPKKRDFIWENEISHFSLNIPLNENHPETDKVISELLHNSKALWRYSEWKTLNNNSKNVTCVLFGYRVNIIGKGKNILIECLNLKVCQAIWIAICLRLGTAERATQILLGWHQAENIITFNREPKSLVLDLYNILRNSSLS